MTNENEKVANHIKKNVFVLTAETNMDCVMVMSSIS